TFRTKQGDASVAERLKSKMQSWSDQHIVHKGQKVIIDGNSFSAIARITLLKELQALCRDIGVEMTFGKRIESEYPEDDCDILVAANGANSVTRDRYATEFQTQVQQLENDFSSYGAETT